MKHLVLFYDKHKPNTPQIKTFDKPDEVQDFILHKLNAGGTVCYDYSLNNKYTVEPQVTKTPL